MGYMITKNDLIKLNDYLWEIPQGFRSDMLVAARIYATEKMLEEIFKDRTLEQLVNLATLRGIQKYALVMPDAHEGYGSPIGGVAAIDVKEGIISPGMCGYDINCGVRLLRSYKIHEEIKGYLEKLGTAIFKEVPSGVGRGGRLKLPDRDLDKIFLGGAVAMVKMGYGEKDDPAYLEARGRLENADPEKVSKTARSRGRDQLGTMGAGNHFVEVQRVDEIFDEEAARRLGLFKNQVTVMIHTGSRGLGHQVATDYINLMMRVMPKYGIKLPDRELAAVPFNSPEGRDYWSAMAAAANFAWANRQLITWEVRQAWHEVLGASGQELDVVYDVAHNIVKLEEYSLAVSNGLPRAAMGEQPSAVIVHRKGATRSFGPGHLEIHDSYRSIGQPVLIPGSMGTASYVLVGTKQAMEETFGSSCHGAGRRLSRHAAKRQVHGESLLGQLKKRGIVVRAGSMSGLAEEAPLAYKDVEEVVDVVHKAGIAKKVARMSPLVVVKG